MTPADFALLGIDSATILEVWSWGFGSVVFFWSLGYGVGCAVRAIRAV
jgi:hypothetical protein